MDKPILLYSLINTFGCSLGISICSRSTKYMNGKIKKEFELLSNDDKAYYATYSLSLAKTILDYIPKVISFELTDEADEFVVISEKTGLSKILLTESKNEIKINDIIPRKLMKICKYRKNTKVAIAYYAAYTEMTECAYDRIRSHEKYSELTNGTKDKYLLDPMMELFVATLSKKKKCAAHLYNHLFAETDRIVVRIFKKRFVMYDFSRELTDVASYRIKLDKKNPNSLFITFNNECKFRLKLKINNSEIAECIALKFTTKFENIDELFMVGKNSVS